MSPQGLQAQAVLHKIKQYDPKRDTKTGSFKKFLTRQMSGFLQSGVLPENERKVFVNQYDVFAR
jgi:hypothetical protein